MIAPHPAGSDTVNAALTDDHRRLDARMAEAQRLAREGRLDQAAGAFREFRDGLRRHIEVEEEVLFPALEAAGDGFGPVGVMRAEHEQIQSLLELCQAALEGRPGPGFLAAAAELVAVLGAHNFKEERILYPMSDLSIGPEARGAVLRRIASPIA